MAIAKIHSPYAQILSHPKQVRSRDNLSFRNSAQIIDLQIGSGAGAPAAKVTGQRDSHGSVGHCGSDTAM